MTDDYNKRPPDDEPEDDLDWLKNTPDDDSPASRSGDNLGFTGELSWRQELQDAFDDQLDQANNADTPDWQRSSDNQPASGSGKAGSLGFTGELDWLRASGQGQADDDSPILDDTPDWLRADDEADESPAAQSPIFDDSPDWLRGSDVDDELPAAEPLTLDDSPDWLSGIAPTPAEPEAADTGVPDWLARMDLAQSTPSPDESADDDILGNDSMDWLRQDDFGDEDLEPALNDDAPDWMSQLGGSTPDEDALPAAASPAAAPPDTGELAWLQEYAAEPTAEQEIIDPADTGAADIPDWLTSIYDDQPEAPAEAAPVSASWLDDDDDSTAISEQPAEVDMPPWLMENPPTDPNDDLFGEFDTGMLRDAAEADFSASSTAEPPTDQSMPKGRITDWLERESEAAAARIEQDDFLNTLPEFTTATGEFPVVPSEEAAAIGDNWFDENEPEPFDAADGAPAWLTELQSQDELPQTDYELPSDEDLFAGLGDVPPPAAEPVQPAAAGKFFNTGELRDIDDILSAYKDIETGVSDQTGQFLNPADFDMDSLLSAAELEKINNIRRPDDRQSGTDDLGLEKSDWLSDLGVSVGSDDVSAAAIVRKQAQNERDLEDLSDPLRALHAAGLDLPAPVSDDAPDSMKALLIGVPEIIAPAPLRIGKPGLADDLVLNAAQREKINLLQSLVATEDTRKPQLSAIDTTLEDAPDLDDIAGAAPVAVPVSNRVVRRARLKIDRLLIAVVLAAAIILPFVVRGLRIGQLPPVSFIAGSPQQVAFDRVAVLQPGDIVLVATEYGLTNAAELDTTLDTLLRHIFARGARPVIVSTNPIGLLHAKNVLERGVVSGLDIKSGGTDSSGNVVVNPGTGLNRFGRIIVPLRDYVIAPFIAGETIGLRNFTANIAGALTADMNSKPTGLNLTSLNDFALIVVIGERSDDIRRWAEQAAPLTTSPMLIAVSAAAGPLAQPYAAAAGDGLLIGYKDAYTYRAILEAQAPLAPIPGATDVPTIVPTNPPTATFTPQTPTATATITPTVTASLTPTVTQTPTITNTPTITSTPTETPTITPTSTNIRATDLPPTWTPTTRAGGSTSIGEPGMTIQGVVNVSESVNVRDNPSRSGTPVTALPGGSTVQIIGRNEDGTWLQIRLPDDREGWVSAQFIRIIEPVTATPVAYHVDPNAVVDLLSDSSYRPVAFRQDTTTTPEATLTLGVPSTLAAPAAAPLPAQGSPVVQTPYRDQRWYAMTLGLLAIIGIITLGAIINIVRGLLRRGRK